MTVPDAWTVPTRRECSADEPRPRRRGAGLSARRRPPAADGPAGPGGADRHDLRAAAAALRSRKAKAVIHLFMNGGPSQMDLFDPKPELDKHHGKPYFDKIAGEVEYPQGRRRR